MHDRIKLKNKQRIVLKVGTSSLTYKNGKINLKRIDQLAQVLSDLQNSGKDIILVSSGAIAVGTGSMGLKKKPEKLEEKQALAAIGQAELMKIYQKFFDEYNHKVAQILLTRDVMIDTQKHINAKNTLEKLLEMKVLPIINENDTVATDEIEHLGYGDNDRLSADVASLISADLLVILSDIEGLFDDDPGKNKNAGIISKVLEITPGIEKIAKGPNSNFAKGGMSTKIEAVKLCFKHGIDVVITNGSKPSVLFNILDGKNVGTLFVAPRL